MTRGRPPYPDVLTPREWEVLGLIREGLTNEQIAMRLGITERGARFHVSEILSKLYVSSRAEAAAWQPETRPRFAMFAVLFRGAQGVFVLAGVAFIALTVGVAISLTRGGEGPDPGNAANVVQEGNSEELIGLAGEAGLAATQVLPNAQLVLAGYSSANGIYTFRFRETGSAVEVSVLGPSRPPFPRWELLSEARPTEVEPLEILDVKTLKHSPKDVIAAAEEQSARSSQNMGVTVWSEEGQLKWQAMAPINDRNLVSCTVMDAAPLNQMVCERQP